MRMTVEEEVGRGVAYLHARQRRRMPHREAYHWAKEHWMEFLSQLDNPTGKLLVYMAEVKRRKKA